MIDTHTHYEKDFYSVSCKQLVEDCFNSGVTGMIFSATDLKSAKEVIEYTNYHNGVYAVIGVHPSDEKAYNDEFVSFVKNNVNKIVGIGEIGLDYHFESFSKERQKEVFVSQILLAIELNLPIVVHQRDCTEDCLNIIKEYAPRLKRKGVIHCYTGSYEIAKQYVDMGFMLGIGGVSTFKNAKSVVEVIEKIPLTSLVVETDSPYLAPEPFRGKVNDSSKVKYVIEKISEIKNITYAEAEKVTDENAKRMFNLK